MTRDEREAYLDYMRNSHNRKREKRRRERNAWVLGVILLAVAIAIWLLAGELRADDTPATPPTTAAQIDTVLVWWSRIAPRNPLRVESYRAEVAAALVDQAAAHGLPVELVTAMTLRESSGAQTARGRRGEIGLMQVHPGTAARWRCHLGTPAEQIDCGCRMLAHHLARCGTLRGALAAYGSRSGKCRPKPTGRVARMVADRLGLAAEIKKMLDRE
jgi:soluble lytic murein transglycosylase-like protein